jgi:phage shock protein A
MIMRTVLAAVTVVATAGIGYGAIKVAAPGTASEIESLVRDYVLGWSEDACESNPNGCLNARYDRLGELEKEVQTSTRAIRSEHARLVELVAEQEELVAKNGMFLNEGKVQLRKLEADALSGLAPSDGPVQFAGRTYPNRATFKAQLQLLFEEKATLEPSLASARELRDKLQARLDTLMVQAGQISLAKRIVPAQLQLIRANQTLGEFNTNIDMIDGVIRGSEAGLNETKQLISTTKDLMNTGTPEGRAKESDAAFEEFLKN